ncbi:MAG: hypothetical protein E6K64_05180 [Nitrospirae bacterium]|nr:MAG: hypothetical protein E6K64_05180 [Nitrospirota bacterium]
MKTGTGYFSALTPPMRRNIAWWKSRLSPFLIFAFLLSACAGTPKPPDWVIGTKAAGYPDEQFLIGIGQADSRSAAEERAYAAVSRIFTAEVTSQSQDWESYLSLEKKGDVQVERKLIVDMMTKVSTDKLLENVKIAETWQDAKTRLYSALAVMDRGVARMLLTSRIAELDEAIAHDVNEARSARDKLTKIRGLRRAIRTHIARDTYNSDLRVVSGGRGGPSAYTVPELTREMETFLKESLVVTVEVYGDQAHAVRQAIMEGLVRYVRWCADFVVLSQGDQRVVGSVARSGREGHLNYPEASHRALKSLQQEVSSALAKRLAEHIYGDPPSDSTPAPAACPKS